MTTTVQDIEPFTEGVFEDMPIGEYHKCAALSNSGISDILKSPLHYRKKVWTDSKAKRIGSAVHVLALEPEKAETLLPRCPVASRRSKADREAYATWEATLHRDAIRLADDEREQAEAMASALRSSGHIQRIGLLDPSRAKFETSMFCVVKTDEGPCWVRCRPDSWLPIKTDDYDGGLIFDIKTTREDATREGFSRAVGNYGYHVQAALYVHVMRTLGYNVMDDGMLFPVVESAHPYGVGIFALDDQAIEQGHRDFMRAATIWAKCYRTGEWPGYEEKVQTVSLKPWLIDAEVAS